MDTHIERILYYLYTEKRPRDRTPGIIAISLDIDGTTLYTCLEELVQRRLVAQQDAWQYRLTPEGKTWIEGRRQP